MKDTTTQNLLFLLMAAPLGMGGCVITTSDDDAGDDGSTGTPPATDDGSTGDPPATDDGSTGANGSTGQATTAATGDSTGADDTAGSSSGGDAGVCGAYGDINAACYDEMTGTAQELACLEVLQEYYDNYGADCAAAFEDWIVCVSALSCEDFMDPALPGCEKEDAAIDKLCQAKE